MDEILTELCTIRQLMEWQKEYRLARDAEEEQQARAFYEEMLEKARAKALEAYQQVQHEHEVRYHGKADAKPHLVS